MASKDLLMGYKVGEISQALLGTKKSKTNENRELNTLFRLVGHVQPEFVLFTSKTSNKISKKSRVNTLENQDSKVQQRRRDTIEETHLNRKRNLPTSDDEGEDMVQKKHQKASKKSGEIEEDPEKLSRTIFVGNLPVAFTRKKLKCLFTRYGAVESVRFRSAGLAKPDLSRKVAMKKREFHPDRHNINGYVVFKEKEYAIQALESNGLEVNGLHIRVDLAVQDHQHDHLRSVFVGNLPFDAEEEMLRHIFLDCGEVEAVRIIRDSKTGAGKGFGFILFKNKDAVMFALKMNKRELNGRKLRVFPSSENPNSGQAREFKKGKPVAYTFSGLTAKRADRGGHKGRKKKPDFKHAQGRQQRKSPRISTGSKKSTDLKRGGKYKDYNRGKHKTVRTRFLKSVDQGGENNQKRRHR